MKGRFSFGRSVALYCAVLAVLMTTLILGLTGGRSYWAVSEPVEPDPLLTFPGSDVADSSPLESGRIEVPVEPAEPEPEPVIEVTRPMDELRSASQRQPETPQPPAREPSRRPEPPATTRDQPTAPGDFTIQVAAHSNEEEARRTLARLQVAGFDGQIQPPGPGSPDRYYRVWVGRFASREAARDSENALKQADFATYVRRVD